MVLATTHFNHAARRLNGSNGRCLTGKDENSERQGGDAVIHFARGRNPAVENQATDRTHRLGQTKAVFVYKLVVAVGILAEDHENTVKFGEDDIKALLAPLPGKNAGKEKQGRK